jgi:iron complex outermembrane receptor protein
MKMISAYLRNLKEIFFILSFILIAGSAISQNNGYFSGMVLSEEDGKSLVGASIKVQKNPTLGAASDISGRFLLELPAGNYKFVVSFTGMRSDTIIEIINAGQTIERVITLKAYTSKLSGVEIKVGRLDQKMEKLTVSMEVVQLEQIEKKNITKIETILDQTPGLNILDDEPQIRGGSGFTFGVGSKVGVFVDDMPVLSGDANRPYWDFIPVDNIKQIEVVKGASSVLSGSSSLSGAIYVRTAFPGLEPVTKVKVYGGFYNNPKYSYMKWWEQSPVIGGASYLHSRIVKNTDIIIGARVKYDHGYEGPPVTLPNVVDTITKFSESQLTEKKIGLNFNIRHRNQKFPGLNYGLNGNIMYEKTKMMLAWLDDSTGFYRAYPGAVVLQDHFIYYLDPFVNYYSKMGFKHSFKARMMYNNNEMTNNQSVRNTVIFTDYNYRRDYPNLNGFHFIGGFSTQYTMTHAKIYNASGDDDNTLFNLSGYAEIEDEIRKTINFSAGVRFDYNSLNGFAGDVKTIFRAGASLKMMQETYLRMSIGQGYRYPTIAERFVKINLGTFGVFDNPELVPETSINAEIGLRRGLKFANFLGYFDIAVFQQDYKNTIEYLFGFWDPTYTFAIGGFKFLNTGKSRIVGVDVSLNGKAQISDNLVMNTLIGYNYILPRSLEPDYIFANDYNPTGHTDFTFTNTSVNPEGNILKYRFLHTIKGDIEFEYKKFTPGLSIKYFSKIENLDKAIADFERATNATGGSVQPIEYMNYFYNNNNGNLVIDFRLNYAFNEKHKIALTVNNLTNRWYSLRPLKAEAVRSIMLQYSLNL